MADHTDEPRITLHPHTRRVSIFSGDTLITDTQNGIERHEHGYPHWQYIPLEDVDMSKLSESSSVLHCPFKGDNNYYSLPNISDVAWSYEEPIGQAIAGRLAFDVDKVTDHVEWKYLGGWRWFSWARIFPCHGSWYRPQDEVSGEHCRHIHPCDAAKLYLNQFDFHGVIDAMARSFIDLNVPAR